MPRRYLLCAKSILLSVILGLLVGCGGDGGHRVSGKVTFKGEPVPAGKIFFKPDSSKGKEGSTGFADIRNGTYDTGSPGGRGAPAGPVIIHIEGIDPSKPPPKASPDVTTTVLFAQYEVTAELPAAASTKDFDVPESAAKGPIQPKGKISIVP